MTKIVTVPIPPSATAVYALLEEELVKERVCLFTPVQTPSSEATRRRFVDGSWVDSTTGDPLGSTVTNTAPEIEHDYDFVQHSNHIVTPCNL